MKIFFVLTLLIFGSIDYLAHRRNCAFSPEKIKHNFSMHTTKNVLGNEKLREILNQPFHFLGEGAQCYAFGSADNLYVIKFFKTKHIKPRRWLKEGPLLRPLFALSSKWEAARAHSAKKWEKKFHSTCARYKMAFEDLADETGLLHLHFLPSEDLPMVAITSKKGKKSFVCLNQTPFILQKRGELIPDRLSSLLRTQGEAEGKEAALACIAKLQEMLESRTRKGYTDKRQCFGINFGVAGDSPIQLDVGKLTKDALLQERPQEEIARIGQNLRGWIDKNFPALGPKKPHETRITDRLALLSLALSKPFYLSSKVFIQTLTPIRSRGTSLWAEKIKRSSLLLLHSALSPLTVGLGVCGSTLDWLGNFLASKPYFYLPGTAPEKAEGQDYTFFSLNACMFWGGLPLPFGGVRPAEERVGALSSLIAQKKSDFLLLQEVSFGSALELFKELKGEYAHFYTRIGPNPYAMESCLFFASKYPPVSTPYFVPFAGTKEIRRGVFVFEAAPFWIVTTHLTPGFSPAQCAQRKEQFECVRGIIADLKSRTQKPLFLIGDLYTTRKDNATDEYHAFKIGENFIDPYLEKYPYLNPHSATCTAALTAHMLGKPLPEEPWEIDDFALLDIDSKDLFALDVELVPELFSLGSPAEALSDHRALFLRATPQKR